MPSVDRMANLKTSFGFVYKTFQNTFVMRDRAPDTPQTLSGLFHRELRLGECRLLPSGPNASVSPSKMVHVNLSHARSPERCQSHLLLG